MNIQIKYRPIKNLLIVNWFVYFAQKGQHEVGDKFKMGVGEAFNGQG